MRCKCGKEIPTNSRYCPFCGSVLINFFISEDVQMLGVCREDILAEGVAAYLQGDYHKAERLLSQIEKDEQRNAIFCNIFAGVYRKLNIKNLAKQYYGKAIEIDREYWEPYYNLGCMFSKEENFGSAKEAFATVIRLKSDWGLAHYNLGVVHLKTCDYLSAEECFLRARHLMPGYINIGINLGAVYLHLKKPEKALIEYQSLLEHNDQDHDAWVGYCLANKALGNRKEVKKVQKEIVKGSVQKGAMPKSTKDGWRMFRMFSKRG